MNLDMKRDCHVMLHDDAVAYGAELPRHLSPERQKRKSLPQIEKATGIGKPGAVRFAIMGRR
jgi:hypothetical protein